MREMPVCKTSELMGECDRRMWRILFPHVDEAYSKLDLSDVVNMCCTGEKLYRS